MPAESGADPLGPEDHGERLVRDDDDDGVFESIRSLTAAEADEVGLGAPFGRLSIERTGLDGDRGHGRSAGSRAAPVGPPRLRARTHASFADRLDAPGGGR